MLSRFSHVWLFLTLWTVGRQVPLSMEFSNFLGNSTRMGCHALLQGIFPTQGSNPYLLHLLHWQADYLPLSHLRSPDLSVIHLKDFSVSCYFSFLENETVQDHRISNRCYCINQMTQLRQGEQPNSAMPCSQEIYVCATLLLTTVIILVIRLLDFFLCLSCFPSLRSGISWLITLSSLYSRVPDT